jgi:hypothetical protein
MLLLSPACSTGLCGRSACGFPCITVDLVFRGDAQDELADVGAVKHHVDRSRQLLEAIDDGLERLQLPFADPARQLRDGLGHAVEVIQHDEPLQQHALDQEVADAAWPRRRFGIVVTGDQPA